MSASFFANADICHRCPSRRARGGSFDCPFTGRPISEHAAEGECPELRFPSRGLGDTIAKALAATGIAPVAKAAIQAVTGGGCGCDGRQAALNNLVPFKPPEEK